MKWILITYFSINALLILGFLREVKLGKFEHVNKGVTITTGILVGLFGSFSLLWYMVSGIKKLVKWLRRKK